MNFAILTTEANEAVRPLHHRMPVMLSLGKEKDWVPPMPSGMIHFAPFPAELMMSYPVTAKINRASFNQPAAIERLLPEIA